MLKSMTSGKTLLSTAVEKLLHPAWIKRVVRQSPFKYIETGSLTVTVLGQSHRFEGAQSGHQAELMIRHPLRVYWLLKTQGELGFAQAYYEGAVDTNSLYQLMHLAHENNQAFASILGKKILNISQLRRHRKRHNSIQNSRRNISFHYDLGNDFYRLWLDRSMTYSSALFQWGEGDLEKAQHRKYQRILEQLDLQGGESILEIGCGWGGFMEAALKQGCSVKGLTLSTEQQDFARKRLLGLGKPGHSEVALQDYRHETGQYDHIVSIEMFEAVGKEYWHSYFETLKNSLKEGGKAVLQVITIDEKHAAHYQQNVDFIQAYIFPGGLLPSLTQLNELAMDHGFEVADCFEFGRDYAKTCQIWKHDFNRQSERLENLGYDRAFQRLWNYYLDYCTVGFESGHISVHQLTLRFSSDVLSAPVEKQYETH